jgi:hypothetical protein
VPGGSDVVLIESTGGGDMVIVNCWLTAGAPPLSVSVTVKVVDPEPQGLPEMPAVVPALDVTSFRHAGSAGILKVYGATPPVNEIVVLYPTPFSPFGSTHGSTPVGLQFAVKKVGAGSTVIVAVAVTDVDATDVAVRVTVSAEVDGSAVGGV